LLHVAVSKKERGKILTESYDGPSQIPKHPSCFQHLPSAKAFAQLSGHPMGKIGTSAFDEIGHTNAFPYQAILGGYCLYSLYKRYVSEIHEQPLRQLSDQHVP
jgi:hypothetical protein